MVHRRVRYYAVEHGDDERFTTDGELHRNRPWFAKDVPHVFALSAHAPTEAAARVFVHSAYATGAPREIYRGEKSGAVLGFSKGGQRVLFRRFISETELASHTLGLGVEFYERVYPPGLVGSEDGVSG